MKTRWLFICSCIALITSAFTFVVRGDVLQDLGNAFRLTQEQKGGIEAAVFTGMALSMALGGFICDTLGMKRIMWLAFASHLIGSVATIFAPHFADTTYSYYWLCASSLIMGFGNGFTEVGVNPLVATLFPTRKTHYLNMLHAWWPGGLMIGGVSARLLGKGFDLSLPGLGSLEIAGLHKNWQVSLCLIVIPALIYGAMLVSARFPETERVASGVSNADMFKELLRPMFILWACCMVLTAATELGPQKWQESVISSTTNGAVSGTLILIYTSGMMFVLRHFAGPIAHRLSPVGMLTLSAIFSCAGLYLLSFANSPATAFGYATIFGLGIAFFWPTMLGVSAERFPKGGALILALMGTVGNFSIAYVLPQMGRVADHYSVAYVAADPDIAEAILRKDAGGNYISLDEQKLAKLQAQSSSPDKTETPAAEPEINKELQVAAAARSVGFSMAFRWVSVLPAILIFVFGAIALYDRANGGYKPEVLLSEKEQAELMSGGVEAAVE